MFRKVPSIKWRELKENDQIIDVREPPDFKRNHANGANNVPFSNIEHLKTDKSVYVTCTSGMTSKVVVQHLRSQGIDAINIKGGMMA